MSVAVGLVLLVGCTNRNVQYDLGGAGGGGGEVGNGTGGNGTGGSGGSMDVPDLASAAVDLGQPAPPARDLASAPATDAAMPASCTAPAGCASSSAPICCVMTSVSSTTGSGGATCVASCPGSITGTGTSATITTRACTSDTDCANYSGTVNGFSTPWTSCCSSAVSTVHFCGSAQGAAAGGYTCP
jgi:hypothetical protein